MVKFLINRPIGVIMTFLALILLGIYSSVLLPISLLPSINIPEITVRISNTGKPAAEMEKSVTLPLRMQLIQVAGIKDLESESRDGEATIKLNFDYGEDIDMLFVEVNEKVDIAMSDLSRDIPRPRVIKASATDIPVFNINITYADTANNTQERMMELSQLVSKVIRKRFEQLPDVALADITGVLTPEILIKPNHSKLIALGITPDQISQAIQQSMVGRGSIRYRDGQLVFDVIIEQKVTDPSDIGNISVNSDGRIFKINDLAEVKLKPARIRGTFQFNGQPAICMPIIKSTNARMGDMKNSVSELMKNLKKEYPELKFTVSQDQTEVLNFTIVNLRNSLIAGVILAISIMFLFLGDYRSPILMGITIPVSLIISMIFFHLTGLSLNIVSLSGLILGVGMMVDNSIIVIDNITQWRTRGNNLESSVIYATNEVVAPLLSSMLTTCAVFIPLIFLSGIAGAMFFDQAIAIAIGLCVSFWVSITLMPALYYRIQLRGSGKWVEQRALIPLEKSYKLGYFYVFNHWKRFAFLILGLIAILPLLFMKMEKTQMPELTRNEIIANISWGGNISIEENNKRCNRILELLNPQTAESAFFLGRQQLILSQGMDMDESDAKLYFKVLRNVDIEAFRKEIESIIKSDFSESVFNFSYPESAFDRIFPASEAGLVVKIVSGKTGMLPKPELTDSLAKCIKTNFPTLSLELVPTQTQIHLLFNSEAISLYEIPILNIQSNLEVAFQNSKVGSLAYEQQVVPIVFGDSIQTIDNVLNNNFVKKDKDVNIPIRNLVNPQPKTVYRSIFGDNSNSYIPIKIYGDNRTLEKAHAMLLDADTHNNTFSLSYKGEIFSSKKMVWELVGVLLVSIMLLYFVLAAQFESIWQPLIVLIELPIDIGGALIILWIFGGSINLMSLIGVIVMGGIVVNDSILKIDTINRLRREGKNTLDSIAEGGTRRLKSIIMTSLTTILALVPILFGNDLGSELQQPMAITLIAGMTIGTLVSLYIVPLIYWVAYRKN